MRLLRRLATLTTVILLLSACQSGNSDSFISEYEGLNGVVSEGREYMDVSIPGDHRFLSATEEQVRELLDDGDGAIHFGFPECPWCRNAVSPLTEAAAAVNLDQIHYVNVSDIRDQQSVDDDGEVVTEEDGTDYYEFLLDELGNHAPEYPGMEGSGERRILVPLVAAVVDGEIVSSHLGTVESQTDPSIPLDDEQRQELIDIYSAMFEEIPGCGPSYCE